MRLSYSLSFALLATASVLSQGADANKNHLAHANQNDLTDDADEHHLAAVDNDDLAGVDESDLAGVDEDQLTDVDEDESTDVDEDEPTDVDEDEPTDVDEDELTDVDEDELADVDEDKLASVDENKLADAEKIRPAIADAEKPRPAIDDAKERRMAADSGKLIKYYIKPDNEGAIVKLDAHKHWDPVAFKITRTKDRKRGSTPPDELSKYLILNPKGYKVADVVDYGTSYTKYIELVVRGKVVEIYPSSDYPETLYKFIWNDQNYACEFIRGQPILCRNADTGKLVVEESKTTTRITRRTRKAFIFYNLPDVETALVFCKSVMVMLLRNARDKVPKPFVRKVYSPQPKGQYSPQN